MLDGFGAKYGYVAVRWLRARTEAARCGDSDKQGRVAG